LAMPRWRRRSKRLTRSGKEWAPRTRSRWLRESQLRQIRQVEVREVPQPAWKSQSTRKKSIMLPQGLVPTRPPADSPL
jgi:hypothetical protein